MTREKQNIARAHNFQRTQHGVLTRMYNDREAASAPSTAHQEALIFSDYRQHAFSSKREIATISWMNISERRSYFFAIRYLYITFRAAVLGFFSWLFSLAVANAEHSERHARASSTITHVTKCQPLNINLRSDEISRFPNILQRRMLAAETRPASLHEVATRNKHQRFIMADDVIYNWYMRRNNANNSLGERLEFNIPHARKRDDCSKLMLFLKTAGDALKVQEIRW